MSDTAHARNSDPETSHAAAASVDVRLNQAAVLEILLTFGPMTDERLVELYDSDWYDGLLPRQSTSGIRTRRSELVKRGLVQWTGKKSRMTTGRMARLWEATSRPRSPYTQGDSQ